MIVQRSGEHIRRAAIQVWPVIGRLGTSLFVLGSVCISSSLLHAQSQANSQIYTAGQTFASLVAANPPQFYQNRLAIKFTYSWRP